MEHWKEIQGYEGLYKISDLGNVYSLISGRLLNQFYNGDYFSVSLYDKNKKRHTLLVHRLVALAFLPNPDSKANVHHLNDNKEDNRVENLVWQTPLETANVEIRNSRISKAHTGKPLTDVAIKNKSKPVICIESGIVYESGAIAGRLTGIDKASISKCCLGKANIAGGFHWEFKTCD